MSTSDPPPPYPGPGSNYGNNYSTAADYSSPAYPPPPAPYTPKEGDPYPTQPYGQAPPYPTQTYGLVPGYQAPYGQQGQVYSTAVVVNQPPVALVQTYRETPVRTRCNHCNAEVITGIHYETGTFTYVICVVMWLVGCGLGCCLIPFCMDGCKDVIHTCPSCHQQIARYSRM